MRKILVIIFLLISCRSFGQQNAASAWADSVLKTLSPDEKIAQLMIVRLSSIDMSTKTITFYDDQVAGLVKKI